MNQLSHKMRIWAYVFTPLFVLFVDLLSKHFAEVLLKEGESVQILGNFIKLTLIYNNGTTFGLFSASFPFLAVLLPKFIVILAVFVCFLNITKFITGSGHQFFSRICFLVIIGGSCGNFVDRLLDRKVTDFIDVGIQSFRWYVFDFADAFQFLGGLAVLFVLASQHMKRQNA